MREKYNGIDLVKFIMAIFVVMIHLTPLAMFGENANFIALIMTRVAVPFFFCASGFFLKKKIELCKNDKDYYVKLKVFIVRILKLYIIWTIIYLPCSIFWIKNDNKSFLTYIKECLFDGSYLHLWYLPSLIIAALLATVLCKYIKEKYVVLISIILYLVGLADTCWYYWAENSSMEQVIHAYDNIFITTRNGLFFGFAFFMLGVVAVKINYSMRKTLLLLAVSVIGLIVEMYLLRYLGIAKNYDSVIFSLPTTFVLFLTAKNMKLKDSNKYKWLRSAGVLLWFIHCWVDFTYSILCYNILHRTFNSMIRFGYTMLISMILCVIVLKLQKKEKCKWLRNLY